MPTKHPHGRTIPAFAGMTEVWLACAGMTEVCLACAGMTESW